jgi:hypothetical protein
MRRYLSSRRVRERTMSQAAQLEMDRYEYPSSNTSFKPFLFSILRIQVPEARPASSAGMRIWVYRPSLFLKRCSFSLIRPKMSTGRIFFRKYFVESLQKVAEPYFQIFSVTIRQISNQLKILYCKS